MTLWGTKMRMLVGWSVIVGLIWFLTFAALQVLAVSSPDTARHLEPIMQLLEGIGVGLATFIKPLLQLAIVLLILLEAAKRLGFVSDQMTISVSTSSILQSKSIQAVIAIIIVAAVSISALAGVGDTAVLKDLALVVVGFYFGTKAKEHDGQGDAISPDRAPAPPATGPSIEPVQQAAQDAWKANPGTNSKANGPYLGKRKDPSQLPSVEEFNQDHEGGPSGRRSH
jgi:hypothetical protein